MDQGATQTQLLLHAPGEIHGLASGELRKPRGGGELGDAQGAVSRVEAEQAAEKIEAQLRLFTYLSI